MTRQNLAIQCYECGKALRTALGVDIADIHTSSDGEDVCEACCDECKPICGECDMPISERDHAFDNAVCQSCLAKAAA